MKVNVRYFGAFGFGIGGFVVGLSGDFFINAIFFMGLIGSAMLRISVRSIKLTVLTSLLGVFGFGMGLLINIYRPIYENISPSLITLLASGVVGIMLGHAALLTRRVRK